MATLLLFLWDISFFGPLILLQTLIYLALSIKEIKLYHTVVKQTNANSDASLNWLNQFIGGVVILFLFDLIRNIVSIQGPFSGNGPLYNILIVLLVVMINLVVFKSLNHSSKFLGISEVEKQIEEDKKEIHLELDGTEIESFAERMESFLIKNETFRRAELTILEFSELVNENPRIVSQVINHHFGTNFSDWINNHRLDYAKNLLKTTTNREKNISQILYESGFNSTSSFYHTFSRKVGMSPKDFRKKHSI
ncbi:MAG: helix-turn-helix domain-containing protein [Flagellimonas sp.]